MGTFFFFLTIFVIPGFPSGALVGRWGLLALCAATLLFKTELPKSAWALLAYLAVMAWRGPVWYEAVNIYIHAAFFVVIYCYAVQLTDLRRVAIGVALGMTVNSAATLAQHFLGWNLIPEITPGSGLYFNRNIASETAAMALSLAVGYRLWWLVPGILPTLAFGSRIPVLALGVAGAFAVYRYSKFYAALAILLPLLIAVAWLQGHGDNAVTAGVFDTLMQRMGTWYDGAHGFTLFGQGLGSWMINFPLYQVHSNTLELRWENAHNDAVQLFFELGIGGAVLVAIFAFRLAIAERGPAFYALLVFAVEGCFGFPLYQPVTGALAVVLAGFLFGGAFLYIGLSFAADYQYGMGMRTHEAAYINRAAALYPLSRDRRLGPAYLAILKHDLTAIKTIERALVYDPHAADLYFGLAGMRLNVGDQAGYNVALTQLEKLTPGVEYRIIGQGG